MTNVLFGILFIIIPYLRPRGKGKKLAWQGLGMKHNDAEDADAAKFAAGGDMPTASPGGLSHGQTAWEPASRGGGGVVKYEAQLSFDWRFQPPNTSLKQEGLQLAEASFRDRGTIFIFIIFGCYFGSIHLAMPNQNIYIYNQYASSSTTYLVVILLAII